MVVHTADTRTSDRAYYLRNRDKRLRQVQAWQKANPEAHRAAVRRHDAMRRVVRRDARLNSEERAAVKRVKAIYRVNEWGRNNPEALRVSRVRRQARRRARLAKADGVFTKEQFEARWNLYGGSCWMCGGRADSMDHVIPLARGGSNWPANLRPACRSCNSRKGARH